MQTKLVVGFFSGSHTNVLINSNAASSSFSKVQLQQFPWIWWLQQRWFQSSAVYHYQFMFFLWGLLPNKLTMRFCGNFIRIFSTLLMSKVLLRLVFLFWSHLTKINQTKRQKRVRYDKNYSFSDNCFSSSTSSFPKLSELSCKNKQISSSSSSAWNLKVPIDSTRVLVALMTGSRGLCSHGYS